MCEYLYYTYMYIWMYVCMYMCMNTCTCMSCIYIMSWIHRYMYVSIPSPSGHHLARCHRRRWQYRMLEFIVWDSRGNWGRILRNFAHQRDILQPVDCFPHSCSLAGMAAGEAPAAAAGSVCKFSLAAMPWWSAVWAGSPELIPRAPSTAMFGNHTFLWPLGGQIEFAVLAGQKSWLRNEGSWPVPPRGTTTRKGRELELWERFQPGTPPMLSLDRFLSGWNQEHNWVGQ